MEEQNLQSPEPDGMFRVSPDLVIEQLQKALGLANADLALQRAAFVQMEGMHLERGRQIEYLKNAIESKNEAIKAAEEFAVEQQLEIDRLRPLAEMVEKAALEPKAGGRKSANPN